MPIQLNGKYRFTRVNGTGFVAEVLCEKVDRDGRIVVSIESHFDANGNAVHQIVDVAYELITLSSYTVEEYEEDN